MRTRQHLEVERDHRDGRLRALFDGTPHGLLIVDRRNIIRDCGLSAARMLGRRPEDLIGQPASVLTGAPGFPKGTRTLDALRQDGTPFPLELSIGEVSLADGEGFQVAVVRDLSNTVREQERQRDRAERSSAFGRSCSSSHTSPRTICRSRCA